MKIKSAGILVYRYENKRMQIFLVHPGGPFWKNKDYGAWSIPKGEFTDEEPLEAAKREFKEETGTSIEGYFLTLESVIQKNGKQVYAWAVEEPLDPTIMKSNLFEMIWPPKSNKKQSFPEIDAFSWFDVEEAKKKIIPAQAALIDDLVMQLAYQNTATHPHH